MEQIISLAQQHRTPPHKPRSTAYYRNTAVLSNTVWLSPYPKTNTSPKTSKIGET
jgi:hypothetical protein